MTDRLDNLSAALNQMPTLANQEEVLRCLDGGRSCRYLALTRSDQGRLWAYFCPDLTSAGNLFAEQLCYQDSHRPFALIDLDQGTMTQEIKVTVTVDYLEPLTLQAGVGEADSL